MANFFVQNIAWIVSIASLLVVLGTVLVTYGAVKQKIISAYESSEKLRQELYKPSGVTIYVPREEYESERKEVMEIINSGVQAMKNDCLTYRQDCQNRICGKVDELKKEVKASQRVQAKQSLGLVAISTSLKLLLVSARIKLPEEIEQIEQDLKEEPN